MPDEQPPGPDLPPTSWAMLGLLSFGQELSGYDAKQWADYGLAFFYWSPSVSQVYGELKRLERIGYASSRLVAQETGDREKRVYALTEAGRAALVHWAGATPVPPPVLKHGPMLRLWLGHLLEPDTVRGILVQHQKDALARAEEAAGRVEEAVADGGWEYTRLIMRWAERYHRAEHDLAVGLLADLEELQVSRGSGAFEDS
ncbi:PadR family transcriptional regulator [Streptomyces sp. SID14478]|uniref:PadR family transcriptional regulator n=1 Tax=Streptomyces sp. SID14478 TaxID=2706073 RepID=UPI0013E07188|nr:PadR family transcriptional regulator [Streptomyces sp. SID14478]NEB81524.1 PadR family transcriptional regulator [Streptomyces sp. SID14478]